VARLSETEQVLPTVIKPAPTSQEEHPPEPV
jgi:hypothetical protein